MGAADQRQGGLTSVFGFGDDIRRRANAAGHHVHIGFHDHPQLFLFDFR